ncbi:MAG: hypothetical protein A2W91_14395 [Bacteroidetes bacterium GWF2_38_335]|nr:MAG: hypothetical protein A2W91_14395 [Bacteroidetes bacterium GWF2_38_335]OFY79350.1 MAG: hypothetical protein A2281_16760 [Bacteroidetes bacterium RIFOXYA12_FULL_38_20]HBS85610.1 class D beta-lactamase [Bacteroidales bacterium]
MNKLFLSFFVFTGCFLNAQINIEKRADFKNLYDSCGLTGIFAVYDSKNDKYIVYNEEAFNKQYTPASTFKICNSMIGLETGVISDEDYVIKWDSVKRPVPAWNSDHDLKTAFRNSTVWYYQELARRVGAEKMKFWLDKTSYGNADTTGGVDRFWLTGGLKISPAQQIEFLKKLHDNDLPFTQKSMDVVKKIMLAEETKEYTLRAKTGWGTEGNTDIGWYVGYVETKNNVYYFVNCIFTDDQKNKFFAKARKEIAMEILKRLGAVL